MIEVSHDGPVWTLRLNRPDKANSLTHGMLQALDRACEAAAADGAAALVLTGAGRVFSAGADLDEAKAGLATDEIWEQLSARIASMPCLTVAALNGTLAGGAFGMALACDIRVAVPEAKFFYPVMKLGFLPQPSDPGRLMALVGPARAKMILLAAERIDAQTALSWGLIDRLVMADELEAAVEQLVSVVRTARPGLGAEIKTMLRP